MYHYNLREYRSFCYCKFTTLMLEILSFNFCEYYPFSWLHNYFVPTVFLIRRHSILSKNAFDLYTQSP